MARWSSAEDDILREYVKEHGEGNWRLIEENSVLRRSGKSCRLRWRDHLRSDLKKSPISIEEEALLIRLHKKMGNKWSRMAKHFPGRTDNELKNFWNTRRRRRSRDSDQKHQQIDAQSPRRCSADLLEIPAFITLCFLASGAQAFYARMFTGNLRNRMSNLSIVSVSSLRLESDRKSLLRFRSGTEAGLRGLVFDLNLPPVEPPDRWFVVGYALLPKKQRSLIRPSLVSAARDRGVYLVPVDPSRPLAEQGHFDCVIHKLRGGEWKAQLADFASENPGVPIVDHPLAIERLHDRISMLQLVSELDAPHGTETFGVPNQAVLHDFSAGALSGTTDLRFPIIAKPLVSDGSAKSHGMSLVYERGDLLMFKPPLLLQEFVNPGGVIFKVYVAGNYVQCVRRKSLRPEQHHSVASDTFFRASVELPPSSFLEKIAMGLRQATGLRLFSFDMIRDADARHHYLIIDVNYFPGYSKMPDYEEFVIDFFWDMVHQKGESAAASSSLSSKD